MKHICIVITARASLARVQTVIEALGGECRVTLIAAGSATLSRYGRVKDEPQFNVLPVEIIETAPMEPHGFNGAATYTGQLVTELSTLFRYINPDTVVVIADRYETLAVSIAASYQNIKLCHLLGGEHSGNIDDKVRFANSALADIHCVATKQAKHTLSMSVPQTVHLTGCPSVDLIKRAKFPGEYWLNQTGVGVPFDEKEHSIVVMYHPCDDDDFTIAELFSAVYDVADEQEHPHQILWFWPNIDPGAEPIEKQLRYEHEHGAEFRLYRHLPAHAFLGLLKSAEMLVGNSSVGVREAGALGLPVVNVGARQRGRIAPHNVEHADKNNLLDVLRAQLQRDFYEPDMMYGDGHAGEHIAEILLA